MNNLSNILMTRTNPAVTVKEARKILGQMADSMPDKEIADLVHNLDAIAVEAIRQSRELRLKQDAVAMAELIYDVYQDKKLSSPDNR